MGLNEDRRRYREVGEQRRQDLAEFIKQADLGRSRQDAVRIPIKIVDLPEFVYDPRERGGVGQADGEPPEEGTPVERPDDGDRPGEPGGDAADHDYYEMDPEEFAEELDEELGLDLEPKGKAVVEEVEGEYTEMARAGPRSMLDIEYFFREGLKRRLATDFDESYVREALRVEGWGPREAFEWAREQRIPVSMNWLEEAAAELSPEERDRWADADELEANVERTPTVQRLRREGLRRLPLRREDERYRYPEVVERPERNVVVVNIRDASGSMRAEKRELVQRTFAPLDWYLQGKYDHAEFVYIVHDAEAEAVDREAFFTVQSGGGTRISSAYELAAEILDGRYPWSKWNRYVFAAGDSENRRDDTTDRVIPLMEEMSANLHAYVETRPEDNHITATHATEVADHFQDTAGVVVTRVNGADDVVGAITAILGAEAGGDGA